MSTTDILDSIADYAPDAASSEWTDARQEAVLSGIVGEHDALRIDTAAAVEIPLQYRPRSATSRRRHRGLLGASAAALTAAASAIVAITLSGSGNPLQTVGAGSTPFDPPPGLSNQALADGKYWKEVTDSLQLGADGKPLPDDPNDPGSTSGTYTTYLAPDGHVVEFREPVQGCTDRGLHGDPGFDNPTRDFFASLPTETAKLNDYLRNHVQGSSSLDEAVFVAVGDSLRTGDGLASPRLRAAMLAVLSRTPGVIVHEGVPDYLGRTSIRADFVNQAIRPGEVQSLYFDPENFNLLEARDGANGAPTTYDGPSPAYTAPAPDAAVDPDQLTGAAYVSVVKEQQVVDTLPDHSSCN